MNKVLLVGRLTADAKAQQKNETKVAYFTLAINSGKEKVDYVELTAFNQQANFVSEYCNKGTLVSVEGHLSNSSYEKEGNTIYKMSIIVDRLEKLSGTKKETNE